MTGSLLFFVGLFPLSFGWWNGPAWDQLSVRWGLVPTDHFLSQPRDFSQGPAKGFKLKENYCSNPSSPFVGQAYWKNNDNTLVLIMDRNGYIAGMQSFIPASKYTPSNFNKGKSYIQHGDFWVLTVYFVDPSRICTVGRSPSEFSSQGTGTNVYFQNGTNPIMNVVLVPKSRDKLPGTPWVYGACFPGMGAHFWWDLSLGMNCDLFFPFFVMYNGGKLNAIGIIINSELHGPYYDNPGPTDVANYFNQKFMGAKTPKCINSKNPPYAHFTSMHIYFSDHNLDLC